ncbi:MAG TPA: dNTP triphosphohydrolase, partial [Rariglobus sp.]
MLASLRFPVAESRGRLYPEPEHPYRNAFQRDRDRVVHARAFRRLEAKTQVFSPGLSDHFRNRLTHTIEVAQVSRTLAAVLQLDEDLTEALSLAHDIGHPPFAHAGEEALNQQMSRFGEGFDHNLHALRIVEIFEQRYARFPGLNLTFEVREGIVKHSRDYAPGERPEVDLYLPGLRPPLEAQLIDLCDEVAYNTADLDDAFSAGLLTAEEVAGRVPQYQAIHEAVETQFPGATPRERFHESLRYLVDALVTGLIEGTVEAARSAGVATSADVRHHAARIAAFTPEGAATSAALKRFLHAKIYASRPLVEGRKHSMNMIAELF